MGTVVTGQKKTPAVEPASFLLGSEAIKPSLYSYSNLKNCAIRTGNAALHEDEVAVSIDFCNFDVLNGDPLVAHLTGHLLSFEDVSGSQSTTD